MDTEKVKLGKSVVETVISERLRIYKLSYDARRQPENGPMADIAMMLRNFECVAAYIDSVEKNENRKMTDPEMLISQALSRCLESIPNKATAELYKTLCIRLIFHYETKYNIASLRIPSTTLEGLPEAYREIAFSRLRICETMLSHRFCFE